MSDVTPSPIVTAPKDRCAFCDSEEALTLEHVWPQWLAAVLEARGPFKARHYDKEWETPQWLMVSCGRSAARFL